MKSSQQLAKECFEHTIANITRELEHTFLEATFFKLCCMLGNLFTLLLSSHYFFSKLTFSNNSFSPEHYQSFQRFGSRSGPTFCLI